MAKQLPKNRFRLGQSGKVDKVDGTRRVLSLGDGTMIRYRNLISTMAIDSLLENMDVDGGDVGKLEKMKVAAKDLIYSSTIVLGIGIRGDLPSRIGDKCE